MRLISFMLTKGQILAQTKTQTRRVGSERLKPGDRLRGVLKCQGRSRLCDACDGVGEVGPVDYGGAMVELACDNCGGAGRIVEPLVDLAVVEITAVRREVLQDISAEDLDAEGFPAMMIDSLEDRRDRFVGLFPCERTAVITVIEFKYLNAEICERSAAGETLGDIAGWLDDVAPERAKTGTIEAVRAAIARNRKGGSA